MRRFERSPPFRRPDKLLVDLTEAARAEERQEPLAPVGLQVLERTCREVGPLGFDERLPELGEGAPNDDDFAAGNRLG